MSLICEDKSWKYAAMIYKMGENKRYESMLYIHRRAIVKLNISQEPASFVCS